VCVVKGEAAGACDQDPVNQVVVVGVWEATAAATAGYMSSQHNAQYCTDQDPVTIIIIIIIKL
jgi:hypothetical protein